MESKDPADLRSTSVVDNLFHHERENLLRSLIPSSSTTLVFIMTISQRFVFTAEDDGVLRLRRGCRRASAQDDKE